jgi:predicted DNA-binding protein (MmcQ/YjbR family)
VVAAVGVSVSHSPMVNNGGSAVKVDDLVAYCLAKPGAEETYPGGDAELVAKVGGKAFAFIGLAGAGGVSVKCGRDAAEAAEWRDRYPDAVTQSHYVGRYGWNSVDWTGPVPDDEVRELIDGSYDAAVAALPKSRRPAP